MQVLVFHLGKDRYGLPTRQLSRVLPLMELKSMPGTPEYIAGLMNYHGDPVPVVDLCRLAGGETCRPHFGTRILLLDYACPDGVRRMLGIVAEQVEGIEHIEEQAVVEPGIAQDKTPYLGGVTARGKSMLQLVDVDHLLSDEVRALLYPDATQTTS